MESRAAANPGTFKIRFSTPPVMLKPTSTMDARADFQKEKMPDCIDIIINANALHMAK
jgi:hypothetical protein